MKKFFNFIRELFQSKCVHDFERVFEFHDLKNGFHSEFQRCLHCGLEQEKIITGC